MKRLLILSSLLLVLLICFLPLLHGQKTRFGQETPKAAPGTDYPIKVHISGIHIRTHCPQFSPNRCDDALYADATLNGKKVDLMGDVMDITPGDYVARFTKKSNVDDLQKIGQKFEILFPDNTYWRSAVEGFSE